MSEQLILISFGAFIGLITGVLGRVIYDSILIGHKSSKILNGIINELKVVKMEYLFNIYLLYSRYQLLTRENINWLINNFEEYRDTEDVSNILNFLSTLQNGSDQQLATININRRNASIGKSLIPKKIRHMFIEKHLDNLDLYEVDCQYKLIKIMKGIDRLNQQIDVAQIYDMKTFEITDPGNHSRVIANVDISLKKLGEWEKMSVDEISDFIRNYETIDVSYKFQI